MERDEQPLDLFMTVDFPPRGGGESTYIYLHAAHYPQPRKVLTVQTPNSEASDAALDFEVIRVPDIRPLVPLFFLLYTLFIISPQRIRFIHCAQLRTVGFTCLLLKLFFALPYGIHVYGGERSKFADRPLWRRLLQPVLKHARAIFAISVWTKEQFLDYGIPPERLLIVNPAVDTDRFHPLPNRAQLRQKFEVESRQTLLSISRLDPHKGADMVLRALPELLGQFPDLLFVIGGGGSMRETLENMVVELKLENHVRFLGFVADEDLIEWYNAADIFIMPSRLGTGSQRGVEGFGIVYLEANACKTPVLGGRRVTLHDTVEHGSSGLLADPDDPGDIAAAIAKLLADPPYAQRLAAQGRARVLTQFTGPILAAALHREVSRRL